MSYIEELSCDIQRLQSREPRDFAQAFQPLAVTDRARHRLSGLSPFDQRFASGEAAGRHVGDETGLRVADFRAKRLFGDLKDTASNRLGAAGGLGRGGTGGGGR